jgi:hypothetical protein
MWFEKEY